MLGFKSANKEADAPSSLEGRPRGNFGVVLGDLAADLSARFGTTRDCHVPMASPSAMQEDFDISMKTP